MKITVKLFFIILGSALFSGFIGGIFQALCRYFGVGVSASHMLGLSISSILNVPIFALFTKNMPKNTIGNKQEVQGKQVICVWGKKLFDLSDI